METVTVGVIHNVALLALLSVVITYAPLDNLNHKLIKKIFKGIIIGVIGIAIMFDPIVLLPGIAIDARTVLMATSGLFFGIVPTGVATFMLLLFRIYQGGAGIYMGLMMILSSSFMGILMRKYRFDYLFNNIKRRRIELYLFGLLIHLVMVFLTILLPIDSRMIILRQLVGPVLIVYPIGFVLLSEFMISYIDKKNLESRNTSLFANNSAMIVITSKESNRVKDANYAAQTFLGYKKTDFFNSKFDSFFDNSKKKIIFEGSSIREIVLANGLRKSVKVDTHTTVVNSEVLIYNIIRDYTEEIKVKSDLTFKNLITTGFIELSEDIIIICDTDSTIVDCSKSLEMLVGLNKEAIVHKTISNIIEQNPIRWNFKYTEGELTDSSQIMELVSQNGEVRYFSTLMSNLEDAQNTNIGSIIIGRDVTRIKENEIALLHAKEMAEKANEIKTNFMANMSHEIRTPMNGLIGMIDLSLLGDLNDDAFENLTIAKKSAKSLLVILNDILDYTKLEKNKVRMKQNFFSLGSCVKEIKQLFTMSANYKNISFSVEIEEGVPTHLRSDQVRLMQVIFNLIGNAIKFTHEGSVQFRISVLEKDPQMVKVFFQIIDTGIGFSDSRKDEIFERFTQIDESTTRAYGGTGLGLPISKDLVKLLGGNLECMSKEGEGSTFYFSLEMEYKDKSDDVLSISNEEVAIVEFESDKIVLIADDDLVNQKIMDSLLKRYNYKTLIAGNGAVALELFKTNHVDLVLMDMSMPVMNGFKATELIRIHEYQLGIRTPIIAVTAFALAEDKEKCLNAGLDDYITKPLDFDELLVKVNIWAS